MKRVVLGVLALSVSSALMAATPKFDGARISADVKELASDAYEGRSPATAGEEKTVAYLSKQFAAAGLQPGGDLKDGKRLWTQAQDPAAGTGQADRRACRDEWRPQR
ncbi:hypothetical protein G6F65_022776 [Rhizopus arrhizus]|nr:hypothetical protein G6F65_022776 [Rhizopus arrhizus]